MRQLRPQRRPHTRLREKWGALPILLRNRRHPRRGCRSYARSRCRTTRTVPRCELPWLCRCETCGRHPKPSYGRVRKTGRGCGYCSGRHVDPDEAVEVMRAAGFEPLTPYPGSLAAWPCECSTCGKQSSPYYANTRYQNGRCACRQGMRVDPDEAAETMRAAGLKPLEPYPGSNIRWRCRCTKCGKEVTPVIEVGAGR